MTNDGQMDAAAAETGFLVKGHSQTTAIDFHLNITIRLEELFFSVSKNRTKTWNYGKKNTKNRTLY